MTKAIALCLLLSACWNGSTMAPSNTASEPRTKAPPPPPSAAKVVQRNASGGVIALGSDRGEAMEQANKEMEAHCGPGNYMIIQEGEEVVGTDVVSGSAQPKTRIATEWRVHYQCGDVAPPP